MAVSLKTTIMSKIASFEDLYKNVESSVIMTFKDLSEKADQFADWSNCGDKGLPFEFFDGEHFTLPKKDKIKIWGREEEINKKKYKMLYTAIKSDRQGFIEVPISIFRRMPALKEEQDLLKTGNDIGAPLLNRMSDIKRLELLVSLVGDGTVEVREVILHQNDFVDGKLVRDSADKDEKDRRKIVCHRFNLAK